MTTAGVPAPRPAPASETPARGVPASAGLDRMVGGPAAASGGRALLPVRDVVREHARRVLEAPFLADQARRERAADLVRRGFRIVTGGRTSATTWEFRDWKTGAVIVSGPREAVARLDPGGTWYHADNLYADVPVPDTATPGLPPSLARAVEDWVGQPSTPDEEIAEFVGWPVGKVREHR